MNEWTIYCLVNNPMVWLFIAFCIFGIIDLTLVATTCIMVKKLVKGIIKGEIVLKVEQK